MEYQELLKSISMLENYVKNMSKNGRNIKEIEEAKLGLKALKKVSLDFAVNNKKIIKIKSRKVNGTYWEVLDSTNQAKFF